MRFESLPGEIVAEICSLLCFHCQYPGLFPNADVADVIATKASLACLCRTSKRICAIAQPVLYHYYASGNLLTTGASNGPIDDEHYLEDIEDIEVDDKLPVFVHTLIQRPDLATYIKTLQIHDSDVVNGCTPERTVLFDQTVNSLEFKEPVDRGFWNEFVRKGRNDTFSWDDNGADAKKHFLLEQLAIALTPQTEMLLQTYQSSMRFKLGEDWEVKLPALRSLALRGRYFYYHIAQLCDIYPLAPGLEILYALNCGCDDDNEEQATMYSSVDSWDDFVLPNLRKLVIEGLEPQALRLMVDCCPKVEDVEFYIDYLPNPLAVLRALATAKGRLKRLCFGYLPAKSSDYARNLQPEQMPIGLRVDEYPKIRSLLDFEQLEKLVMDQESILCPNSTKRDGTRGLADLFPPSIRSIYITYVHRGMHEDLLHLARAVPARLLKLETVKIGIADWIEKEQRPEIERMKGIEELFSEVGVKASWNCNMEGASALTSIPGGTPSENFVPVPCLVK